MVQWLAYDIRKLTCCNPYLNMFNRTIGIVSNTNNIIEVELKVYFGRFICIFVKKFN